MTSDNNKTKDSSKNKGIKEIEIENKDLLNVFFDKTSSQFESQLFLSRKRMLSAENGQTELSELLKSKLKALDMMLFILSNNKNILKESDLSCCEVLNNLLCIFSLVYEGIIYMCDYIVYFSLVRFNITFVYSIIIINIKPNQKKLFKKKIMFSLI